MFGQKKKKAQFNMMGDSRVTCYDFIRRFDELFESYRAADYKLYHRLSEEEMRPKLDQHLEELFTGDVDDANGDMLDSIILASYRESVTNLNVQRLNHKDMNRRLIAKRVSDYADFVRIREERQKDEGDFFLYRREGHSRLYLWHKGKEDGYPRFIHL